MDEILYILATILTAILSYVAIKIKDAIEKRTNAKIKQDVVYACVRCVEQWEDNEGIDKHKKRYTAENMAFEWLNCEDVHISPVELQALIESAVYELNRNKNNSADTHFLN